MWGYTPRAATCWGKRTSPSLPTRTSRRRWRISRNGPRRKERIWCSCWSRQCRRTRPHCERTDPLRLVPTSNWPGWRSRCRPGGGKVHSGPDAAGVLRSRHHHDGSVRVVGRMALGGDGGVLQGRVWRGWGRKERRGSGGGGGSLAEKLDWIRQSRRKKRRANDGMLFCLGFIGTRTVKSNAMTWTKDQCTFFGPFENTLCGDGYAYGSFGNDAPSNRTQLKIDSGPPERHCHC